MGLAYNPELNGLAQQTIKAHLKKPINLAAETVAPLNLVTIFAHRFRVGLNLVVCG